MAVHVVDFRRVRPDESFSRFEIRQANRIELHQVAAKDGDFAGLAKLNQAGVADVGHGAIAAAKDR